MLAVDLSRGVSRVARKTASVVPPGVPRAKPAADTRRTNCRREHFGCCRDHVISPGEHDLRCVDACLRFIGRFIGRFCPINSIIRVPTSVEIFAGNAEVAIQIHRTTSPYSPLQRYLTAAKKLRYLYLKCSQNTSGIFRTPTEAGTQRINRDKDDRQAYPGKKDYRRQIYRTEELREEPSYRFD